MKRVNYMVELTVDLEDRVDPELVTFDIPVEKVVPQDEKGKPAGVLVAYCTQECPEVVKEPHR